MRTAKVRILNHARELTGLRVRTEKEDMVWMLVYEVNLHRVVSMATEGGCLSQCHCFLLMQQPFLPALRILLRALETACPFRNHVSVFFPFCYKREGWIRNQIFSISWIRLQDHCIKIFFLIAFKTLMGHREIYEHRSHYPLWTFGRRSLLKSINKSGNSQLSRPKLWSGPCCYGPRSFLVVSLLPLLLPISNKILPSRTFHH
jgi:hypothetical protein